MIIITISRDEARTAEKHFFQYMILLATSKMIELQMPSVEYLRAMLLLSLIRQVKARFVKKLATEASKFKIKFPDAEGIAFYSFLMTFPIDEKQVYMLLLRQKLCDQIYRQLLAPVINEDD